MSKKIKLTIFLILISVGCLLITNIIVKGIYNKEKNENIDTKLVLNDEGKKEIKNIELDSTLGKEILELIHIPNLYSEQFFSEVESKGLNDKSKIMFTFAKMITGEIYSSYINQSEEYVGYYITKDDLEKVAKSIFLDASSLNHQDIFTPNSFDSKKGNYIKIPTGFINFSYIKEIPYKIEQANNEITVYTYRLYIDCNTEKTLNEDVNSTHNVYYDNKRENIAITLSDNRMDNETFQDEFIKDIISSGKIDESKLVQGKYQIIREDGLNYIANID